MDTTPRLIVVGNSKGGSGKSTVATLLTLGYLQAGRRVGILDLDLSQKTLTRFFENRRAHMLGYDVSLTMPKEGRFYGTHDDGAERLAAALDPLKRSCDVVVIDTPGADTPLARAVHGLADTVVTPLNDSLVDLDVLALIDGGPDGAVIGPSHYAEMVQQKRTEKTVRDGAPFDWVVLRNRLTNLGSRNKERMFELLSELSVRFGFRVAHGLSERTIFREFFPDGLSAADLEVLREAGRVSVSQSHLVAHQELRNLVGFLEIGGR